MPISNPLDPAEIAVTLDLAEGIADHLEQLALVFEREAGSIAAADMARVAVASLRTSAALLRGPVSLGVLGTLSLLGDAPRASTGAPPRGFSPTPDAAELAALTGTSSWVAPPDFTPVPDAAELAALTEGSEIKRPGSRKRVPKPKAVNKEVSP